MNELLSIENLSVDYIQHGHAITAVRNVTLTLQKQETLALVGESGCGKSTIALAVIGLLPKNESRISSGRVLFDGLNVTDASDEDLRRIRGKRIAMIFQDPFSSLNPVLTIGYQLQEAIELETGRRDWARARELLSQVQLTDADRILRSYPHQLSGGQRQRVMIAIAISRNPDLLIADEPTTALDVTVQDEIIKLLKDLQNRYHMAMLFVTHNLGLVKSIAQNIAVMQAGEIVETGASASVLASPQHPYTQNLLNCVLPVYKRQ